MTIISFKMFLLPLPAPVQASLTLRYGEIIKTKVSTYRVDLQCLITGSKLQDIEEIVWQKDNKELAVNNDQYSVTQEKEQGYYVYGTELAIYNDLSFTVECDSSGEFLGDYVCISKTIRSDAYVKSQVYSLRYEGKCVIVCYCYLTKCLIQMY